MAQVVDGTVTVTTAGTRVPLSATSILCSWVQVQSKQTNGGKIFVGGVTIATGRGATLETAGDAQLFPRLHFNGYDLSTIYVDSAVSGEGVDLLYTIE
jgi:hypothetical protein